MKTAIELIAQERKEQIEKHGRTVQKDAEINTDNQLIKAAIQLLTKNGSNYKRPFGWDRVIFSKMMGKPYKERLIIAATLIAAEYDREDFIQWYNQQTAPTA